MLTSTFTTKKRYMFSILEKRTHFASIQKVDAWDLFIQHIQMKSKYKEHLVYRRFPKQPCSNVEFGTE